MAERTEIARKSEREIVFTRTFDATREVVWRAYTDPDQIPKWWGPRRYETIVDAMDVRPGGRWRFLNRDAEGNTYAFHGEYREVEPPKRLVQTFEFEGAPGAVILETATFEEVGGKTKVTAHAVYETKEHLDKDQEMGMEAGARETYERLAELVLTLRKQRAGRDLVIVRVFNAPREAVWKAWTDPEEIVRWHGPQGFTAPVAKLDLRVGGKYLYCMRGPDGKDIWSTGVFKEVVPMEKIFATDSFADEKGNVVPGTYYGMEGVPLEMLVTVTFEDVGGKTRLTLRHAGLPAEHAVGAGIGWGTSLDKLAALVEG